MLISNKSINQISFEILNKNASRFKLDEVLFFVPTNRKSRLLKKELISANESAVSDLFIETFSTFAKKFSQKIISKKMISETVSAFLLRQSSEEISPEYFSQYKNGGFPKGVLQRISAVILEYKRNGISPDFLLKEISENSPSQLEIRKTKDIASVFSLFEKKKFSLDLFDIGDAYQAINSLSKSDFQTNFLSFFPKVKFILFENFREFSLLEFELIQKLSSVGNITILLHFDFAKINENLFCEISSLLQKFSKNGFSFSTEKEIENPFITHIAKNLFSINPAKIATEKVEIKKSANLFEEIENVARQIKYLNLKEKVNLNSIAIVSNLPNEVSSLVGYVFSDFGIPINLSDRETLDNSNLISSIITILELQNGNYYYKDLLKTAFSKNLNLNLDGRNLKKIASEFKIFRGYNFWMEKILKAMKTEKRNLFAYEKAISDLQKIRQITDKFASAMTFSEFLNEIKLLISELGIVEKILINRNDSAERNLKILTTFLQNTEEIFSLFGEKEKSAKHSLSFLLKQLKSIVFWSRFNVKERSDSGVLVTSVDEIRGLTFDYVFLVNFVDSSFPTKYRPEIFLSKNLAKKENQHIVEERLKLFTVFKSFTKKLFISFSSKNNKKELSVSSFLEDLNEVFIFQKSDILLDSFIFSKKDFLFEIGKKVQFEKEKTDSFVFDFYRRVNFSELRKIDKNSIYNGNLFADELNNLSENSLILMNSLTEKPFSITKLETYAKCPFKFLIEQILKIKLINNPEKEVNYLHYGSFFHSVMFNFFTYLKKNEIDINDKEAEEKLFLITEDLFNKYSFEDDIYFFTKEVLFGIDGKKENSILFHFLENERKNNSKKPSFFEVSFGMTLGNEIDSEISSTEPFILDENKFFGKIDRIDVDDSNFEIIDYKTGEAKVEISKIINGYNLQLPFYSLVAEKLLSNTKHVNDFSYYLLKYKSTKFGKDSFSSRKRNKYHIEELIEITRENIKLFIENIKQGKFPLTKVNSFCKNCDFSSVCRISEIENSYQEENEEEGE